MSREALSAGPSAVGARTCEHRTSSGSTRRLSVVVGEFEPLMGLGLIKVLQEDRAVEIVGVGVGLAALERTVEERTPRVAILDEEIVISPLVPLRLRSAQSQIAIIVLVHRPTCAYRTRLLALGVTCVPKKASPGDLLTAVHLAADGDGSPAHAADHALEWTRRGMPSLTPREAEVLACLSSGSSDAEVAATLHIGVETARSHAAHLRRKFGVRSRRELMGV